MLAGWRRGRLLYLTAGWCDATPYYAAGREHFAVVPLLVAASDKRQYI
jgi:hypothetical protein